MEKHMKRISASLSTKGVSRIILFDDESEFRDALKSNPQLCPLWGETIYDRSAFPGVFIAGYDATTSDNEERS